MSRPLAPSGLAIRLSGVSVQYRIPKGRKPRMSLKELTVNFGRHNQGFTEVWALKKVNLDIEAGEVVGVIGRNGAGKSTLLAVVSGVLEPVAGTVSVRGRIAPLLSLGAAFDNELSGRENVYLNAALLGFTRREVDARYDEIVAFAEIPDFMEAPFKTFSSGMGARLGFAVATAAEADILLVDEVLAVGDERFRKKCEDRIETFRQQHMTIMYVSHQLETVEKMCTRCIWLEQGQIVAEGKPADVISQYRDFMAGGTRSS
jgi:ABC-type polysaccharide/polyol phosphate transport system ATPase subunit